MTTETTETTAYSVEDHVADMLGVEPVVAPTGEATTETATKTPLTGVTPPITETTETTTQVTETAQADYNPVVDHMRSTFAQQGITIEIPDEFKGTDVPAEKVYQFINDTLEKKMVSNDPFVSGYMAAKQNGKTAEQYIEEKVQQDNLLKTPSKDFLMRLHRARNGKTETLVDTLMNRYSST